MDWADHDMGQIILNQHAMIDAAQTDITMATVPDLLEFRVLDSSIDVVVLQATTYTS